MMLVTALALSLQVLRVGTSGDYAPFSADGAGFDVDVATLLAADLGARVEWVPFDWPELSAKLERDEFDVAMSGVTWQPERALVGYSTRAVAAGGPCVVGAREPKRVAVNRGGILERWTRRRFPRDTVRTVDENRSLPALLDAGEVDAIVTDTFELAHFARPGAPGAIASDHSTRARSHEELGSPRWRPTRDAGLVECAPPTGRKVYWVAPARAAELGPKIDAWLAANESRLASLRTRWFGQNEPRDEADHLGDLVSRRLELMPYVAAAKRSRGAPIEDREREAIVLGSLPPELRDFFRVQIELSKTVQRRSTAELEIFDLATELRPALSALDRRIVESLLRLPANARFDAAVLEPMLEPAEIARLRRTLENLRLEKQPESGTMNSPWRPDPSAPLAFRFQSSAPAPGTSSGTIARRRP